MYYGILMNSKNYAKALAYNITSTSKYPRHLMMTKKFEEPEIFNQ